MMMGFGFYGNGGGSSSSSSSLSALAQPFTVDRSVSKPLVDLSEPPLNWLNTHSFPIDSSSQAYPYTFNSPSSSSDSIKTSNFVEAKPYYPSYISPDYTQSLSGLWEGSGGWNYGKNEMSVLNSSVYRDHTDEAAHSSKVLNTYEEKSNILGCEKYLGSGNIEQLDYKSFPGQSTEFMPVEYSRKSFVGSNSLFPETCSLASSSEQPRSRNIQMPYSASYEKDLKQHSSSPNDIASIRKPSPGLVMRSAVGLVSSAPNISSFNNVEFSSLAESMDFAANTNFSHTKDFHTMQSSGGKVYFDSSNVSFHLEGDNCDFLDLPSEKDKNLLSNVSVTQDPFRVNSGTQAPHVIPAGLNLTLDGNKSSNCFENSSESLDCYNPAVDSPCWKGAPVSYCSPLETSRPAPLQLTKTVEASIGSNLIGPTNNALKLCTLKPTEFSMYQGYGCPENDLTPSPERLSVTNLLFQELGSHDDVKEGSYYSKSSYGQGFQLSDDIEKPIKEDALSKKSIYEFNFKPFHSKQQSLEDCKLTSERKCESGTGVADVERMITSDSSEGCSSHVPFHATEHVLSSPPSVEVAPTKLTKLHGEELAPKICLQTLINTMHNLSELLLFHCMNEVSELKKQELSALKNVVHNLDKCISKNLGPGVPPLESLCPEKSSQFLKDLPQLHECVTVNTPQVTKAAAVTYLNQPDYRHPEGERKCYIASTKLDEKFCDFASMKGDADRVKDDKMIQAIKKVLDENFFEQEGIQSPTLLYKNLWLEAEAALCSVNYRARFSRMKIEMEKCKSREAKDLSENGAVTSESLTNNAEVETVSWSTFSPDANSANKLIPEINDDLRKEIAVPKSSIATTSSHPDDVMARFHILKRIVESENLTSPTDAEKMLSSEVSYDPHEFDPKAAESKDDETPDIPSWNFPVLSPPSLPDDVEASVTARFQILKSRNDNSIHSNRDAELLTQDVDLGFSGTGNPEPAEDEILDVIVEPASQHNFTNHTRDSSTVKEFHLQVKDDPVIHVQETNELGNQLPAAYYDSSSSDWEHVLKEELPGQS